MLAAAIAAGSLIAVPSHADVIPTGLIGHWAGDGNANDSSPTANHGTFSGAYTSGVFGNAFDLSGPDVFIPDAAAYSFGPDFSLSLWFNSNGTGGGTFIAQDTGGGSLPKWFLNHGYNNPNRFLFHINGAASATLLSNETVLPAGWNHLAMVKDNDSYSFYLNGSGIGSQTSAAAFPNPSVPIAFGFAEPLVPSFNGFIDEVAIYNRALSGGEVATLATPEPGSAALLLLGAGAFAARRRR